MNKEKVIIANSTLNGISPAEPDAYDRAISAYKSIRSVPFFILQFLTGPLNIFRSRTHAENNFFSSFSEIGITPGPFIKNYGRCNKPGQPVFYCSDFRPTSYLKLLQNWVEEKKR